MNKLFLDFDLLKLTVYFADTLFVIHINGFNTSASLKLELHPLSVLFDILIFVIVIQHIKCSQDNLN